ncbi:MAG: tagaturonate epimerase family protein [bacterium]
MESVLTSASNIQRRLKTKNMRWIDEDQALSPDEIIRSLKAFPVDLLKIYPRSFCHKNGLGYGLVRTPHGKKLAIMGERSLVFKDPFQGNCHHQLLSLKLCDLSAGNTESLMELFPYTKPVSLQKYPTTVGTADRLGVATPGHLRAIRRFAVHPVLAQQSVMENTQTGRDFTKVIQDAAWAVFQENYQEGYGADGDHLQSLQEVKCAVNAGVSMVTLDLSKKADLEALREPKERIDRKFNDEIDEGDAKVMFHLFLDKEFVFRGAEGEFTIRFDEEGVKRNALLFREAFDFTEEVYEWIRSQRKNEGSIDLEISMAEAPFTTSPENHFFFALELSHRGVRIQSLAPRFIRGSGRRVDDSRGGEALRRQFYRHTLIAQDYGRHKISIHSGSDKFSLFSNPGESSKRFLHLKIHDTSWREAVRLIATANPTLFREMRSFARSRFEKGSKLSTTDPGGVPILERRSDEELPGLLEREESRELFDTTYGYLLDAKDEAGKKLFRDRIYDTLMQDEEDYWSMLETHVEKHLKLFGVGKKQN